MAHLLKLGLVRNLIVPLLVTGLAFPPSLWAVEPPRPTVIVAPEPETGGVQFQALGDNDEARVFADKLLKSIGNPEEKEVHVYHIEGIAPDPRLKVVLAILAQAGVEVKGTLVTAKRYDEVIAQYNEGGAYADKIETFALAYEKTVPAAERKSFLSFLHPKNLYAGLKKLKTKIFGLPKGITLFTHFFKKDADGKWVRRFAPDKKTSMLALITSVLAIGNITLVRLVAPLLFGTPAQPMDTEFWLINGLVFGFVYLILYFQREVSSFRSQGATLKIDPTAEEGKQLTVAQNDTFFTTACITQEWTLNGAITALQMGLGTVPPGLGALSNAAMNGALAAYAYIAPEDVKGKWLAEAEKVKKEDPKRAERLNSRAFLLALVFWNLVFPTFKNLNFFVPGTLAMLPFLLLGSLGFAWKQVKSWRAPKMKIDATIPAPRCPDLLVIAGRKTEDAKELDKP